MKVLLITVRSDFGGGPRHVDQLINNLPTDVELYLAYPKGGDPYGNLWDNNEKIKGVLHIPYRKFSVVSLMQLMKFVNAHKIEIVHSHGNGAGIYSRMLKFLGCHIKVIHTFHGISDYYKSKIKGYLMELCNKILCRFTDAFVLVSYGERDLGKQMGYFDEHKAHVIYNGIRKPELHRFDKRQGFNIVTLSRFDFQKNMDFCYDIASAFKQDKNVKFVWVGDGDDRQRLEEKAKEECVNIEFTGFSTKPLEILASCSIYLSTSRFEGLPYALIEAASLGLPIVATDVKGNNECVDDGMNGKLFVTKEQAVEFIRSLASDDQIRESMSCASRKIYNERFSEDVMIKNLYHLYTTQKV